MEELRRLAERTSAGASGSPPQSSPSGGAQLKSNLMVVDDQPANLKLLEDLLTQQGHTVRSFPRGKRLKADVKLSQIPVLFLSALNQTRDKVSAFRAGGVDYITKPFQLEEVRARVETHLQLHRARQVERELLERTLGGAVKALSDLAHLSSPTLTQRSGALRSMVLEDDIVTEDGSLTVISKGTTLTVTLIERVRNFAKTRGVRDPIQVRAPKGSYVDELQRLRG
jgi:DNA-binding response OmpR family regulator